jgi:hypothetical protein
MEKEDEGSDWDVETIMAGSSEPQTLEINIVFHLLQEFR